MAVEKCIGVTWLDDGTSLGSEMHSLQELLVTTHGGLQKGDDMYFDFASYSPGDLLWPVGCNCVVGSWHASFGHMSEVRLMISSNN